MFSFDAHANDNIPRNLQHKSCFFPEEEFGVSWDLRYDQGKNKKVPARYYKAYNAQLAMDILIETPPAEWKQWIDKWSHKCVQWLCKDPRWTITALIAIIAIIIAIWRS